MTEIKKYNLVHIKRAICGLVSNILIASIALFVYMTGLRFELYSDHYEMLVYLALASLTVLPIFDYLSSFYFNRNTNEYVALHGDKIKIRTNVIFKNSGSQEKVIDKDRVESVSLQYTNLPCFERVVVRYDGSIAILYKKDFKVWDFQTVYREIKKVLR